MGSDPVNSRQPIWPVVSIAQTCLPEPLLISGTSDAYRDHASPTSFTTR